MLSPHGLGVLFCDDGYILVDCRHNIFLLAYDESAVSVHERGSQYHWAGKGIYHKKRDTIQGVVQSNTQFDNGRDGNGVALGVS